MNNTHQFRHFALAAGSATAVVGLVVLMLARGGWLGELLLVAAAGGLLTALLLAAVHGMRRPIVAMPDPFARTAFSVDTINISHIRVAGLGGLGLVLAAAVVVLQYELLTAVIGMGLVGGLACAVWLIHHRRRTLVFRDGRRSLPLTPPAALPQGRRASSEEQGRP